MKLRTARVLALLATVVIPSVAYAHEGSHASKNTESTAHHCSTCDYKDAMDKMHHNMMNVTYSGDPDTDFALGMIPHHQGAVDMAETELRFGKDKDMLELARWIVQEQKEEIGYMREFARGRINPDAMAVTSAPHLAEYQSVMEKMHHGMMIGYTGDPDTDFARSMIPHHQGAVDMATVELHNGKNPEMLKFADKIYTAQQDEIGIMQRWLEKHPAPVVQDASKKPMHHTSPKSVTAKPTTK